MTGQLLSFPDFHLHGASAPEWNQRYWQMSAGVMRSSLAEWSAPGVHAFGKWMSERVVQQGGLPRGRVCLSLLGHAAAGGLRVQGQAFGEGDLLVLRGGDDFEFQRPAGVELLSVTFPQASFDEALDLAAPRRLAARRIVRPSPAEVDALRLAIRLQLAGRGDPQDLLRVARDAVASASPAPRPRASTVGAARLVKDCQAIALAVPGDEPLRIEQLCRRLRTSRRTLQDSFNRETGTAPLAYLRNVRLNAVRRRLMGSSASELSVSAAAGESGFDHLGHFAGAYKALFGEAPSKTRRAGA